MGLLDVIFPKRCVSCKEIGSYICSDCFIQLSFSTSFFCLVCNRQCVDGLTHPGCRTRYVIDGCFSSVKYSGIVKKLMYKYKFQPYISDLSEILVDIFYEGLIQNEFFYNSLKGEVAFVPIPLHKDKESKRGYDQVVRLSKGLSKKLSFPSIKELKRVRKTHSQYGLSRKDRLENVKNAFELISPEMLGKFETVVLVDDVVTSGATFLSAADVLKRAGCKSVYGVALAHGG